ncbi:MAG: hypothetical protein AAB906_02160 [Patescibacteria group bacterium]
MLIHEFVCPICKKSQLFGFNQQEIKNGGKKTTCRSDSCKNYFLWIPLSTGKMVLFLKGSRFLDKAKAKIEIGEKTFMREIICPCCDKLQYVLFEDEDIPHGGKVWRCLSKKGSLLWVPIIGHVINYLAWIKNQTKRKR